MDIPLAWSIVTELSWASALEQRTRRTLKSDKGTLLRLIKYFRESWNTCRPVYLENGGAECYVPNFLIVTQHRRETPTANTRRQ